MTSQKRKFDQPYHSRYNQPFKKPRPENDHPPSSGEPSQGKPPTLPSILTKYEDAVFTHCSVAVQSPDSITMVNYERLEFLGDAQIEHIASLVIWDRFPSAAPGKMSTMREALVKNETLNKFSKMYGFEKKLKFAHTSGSLGISQKEWHKVMADVFEAYVACVILSDTDYHRGFETAKTWLMKLWQPALGLLESTLVNPKIDDRRSKEELGKMVLAKGIRLSYVEEKERVQNKAKGTCTYFIGVYLDGWGFDNQHLGSGEGESKSIAGQEAANNALKNPLIEEITKRRAASLEQKKAEENGEKVERVDSNTGIKPGVKQNA
ncbi:hypothetical protein H2198_009318 [Neophaeococcomyces mojaviensis]|uniref:Uncharacterized protein n=1 Tax=Neophaeococcomyces mojaviensis TaxID=3383035 RepID=A0ACC2ZUT3_9EURO|nr:hypothetical protein H2198_009318 [Knufia sp. JES_112]